MKKKTLFIMLVLICVYSLAYVTESVATWDFSGSYTESREDDITLSETTLTYTLIQDAKGKLTGSGTFDYYSDENDISIDFEIKGKVKGKNNIVTLKYTLKGKGSGYVLGDVLADVLGKDTDVKLKDKVSLELNKSSLSLMGTMKRKLCELSIRHGQVTIRTVNSKNRWTKTPHTTGISVS